MSFVKILVKNSEKDYIIDYSNIMKFAYEICLQPAKPSDLSQVKSQDVQQKMFALASRIERDFGSNQGFL